MVDYFMRFHPDLWITRFNFEAISSVTTVNNQKLAINGHFRTNSDYITATYETEDKWNHNYTKYPTNFDYTDCYLSFETEPSGYVADFNDIDIRPAAQIEMMDGTIHLVTLGFQGVKNKAQYEFEFDGSVDLPHTWIDPFSVKAKWVHEEEIPPTEEGGEPTIKVTRGEGIPGEDFDMDYVLGKVYTDVGGIPWKATVTLYYEYNTHQEFIFDFNDLWEGYHLRDMVKVQPDGIASISLPLVPKDYEEGVYLMYGGSYPFQMNLNNITVFGGFLGNKPKPLEPHPYRVAEGYDDEYDKNPRRLVESMYLLGYRKIINLYIGASHFYDKRGSAGESSVDHHSMKLIPDGGVNNAYRTWLLEYSKTMHEFGFEELVVSVAMENLQMPEDWRQLIYNGEPGSTGWEPPTNFYSPNNDDVKRFVRKITNQSLDIVRSGGVKPILQLGESWYWWQEFMPGDINTPYEWKPPCIYDQGTVERFRREMGYDLPIYTHSEIEMTEENEEVAWKLRQYLGEYTLFMKEIADEQNVEFTILFFPPSVLDKDRAPEFMRIVNSPFEYWEYPNLDFIQIEDYDWVVHGDEKHSEVFMQAWNDMGYPYSKQHYFSGFVWEQFNIDSDVQWERVERAAQEALGRNYLEIFIWAGTQIRRDSWLPKFDEYVGDFIKVEDVRFLHSNKEVEEE